MSSYDFRKRKGNRVEYGPSDVLRYISAFFLIFLMAGFYSVIIDGSMDAASIIPIVVMLILLLGVIYRDKWIFDNDAQEITYIWGFGPFVSKKILKYKDVQRIEVTHFIKGIPSTAEKQQASWKHRSQVVLSIRIDEDTKHDIEIIDEKRSGGKLERNASWLSGFTGFSLFVDRPRDTKSYGGVEEIFFKGNKKK